MGSTARRAATTTVVALAIVVTALALWKIKLVVGLIFLGFTLAAAMRPGVDWLRLRAHVPRAGGIVLHYAVLLGLVVLALWLVVPRAIDQVQQATSGNQLQAQAQHSKGIKHELLTGLQRRLERLPSADQLVHPAVEVTKRAFEALVGVFFVLAVAAYWISERDRTIALVQSLVPRRHRRVVRDTWVLIDGKLGAYVRGQILLVVLVAAVLSGAFFVIGLPYWLLIGVFAGVVEIVPVIGPLAAGVLAVGVGLTQSWHTGLLAGLVVLLVRWLEDYVVIPRVLGHAVGLSPLLVLVSVTAVGILLGPLFILLAIPLAAVAATLLDVIVRDVNPAEEEVPQVMTRSGFGGS